jgi:hypothetical protein
MEPLPEFRVEQRRKAFDTLSTVGAGVAGIGLGLVLPAALGPTGAWLLAAGLAAHLWGMFGRHRLDMRLRRPAWWETTLYWVCWVAIVGLVLMLFWQALIDPQRP